MTTPARDDAASRGSDAIARPAAPTTAPNARSLRLDAVAELQPGRFACARDWREQATEKRRLPLARRNRFEAITNESLCGVRYRVTNLGRAPVFVAMQVLNIDEARRNARAERGAAVRERLEAGGSLALLHPIPPTGFRTERNRIVVAASYEELPDPASLIPPVEKRGEWRRVERDLDARGIAVASATHKITKKPRYR